MLAKSFVSRNSLKVLRYSQFLFSDKIVRFTIKDFNDNVKIIQALEGQTVMKAGVDAGVKFQQACGGNAECATCHCYIPHEIMESPGYTEPEEKEMDALDFAEGSRENSRLACQLKVTQHYEGKEIMFLD